MGRRQPSGPLAPEPPLAGSGATRHDLAVDHEAAARTLCLNMLSARAQTRAELAARLSAREIPDEVSAQVLDRFTEVGLVDDAAFAAAFVSARQGQQGLAPHAITRQLRLKGVAADVVAAAVADIDGEAEHAAARRLVQRRLSSMSGLADQVRTRRLVALLARKGYSPQLCYAVVREVLGEQLGNGIDDGDNDLVDDLVDDAAGIATGPELATGASALRLS